jgi:serine/threonine-protein kinase
MTEAGLIIGTAAYMSPEQARGRPVDKRADIWAYGAVLYEMLTGRRAFGGADTTETLTAVLRDTPDWTALPASTPASVRRLLDRCLERDPKRRLRDIGDALHDIDDAASGRSEPAGARAPARPRWWAAAAWAAAGAIVTGLAAFAMLDRANEMSPGVSRVSLTPPSDAPPRIDAAGPDLTITPDGRRIIYEARRRDPEGARVAAGQLVVRGLDAFEPAPIANLGLNPRQPFTSPDGAWIGFETTVGARVAPVLAKAPAGGGSMVVLCDLGPLGPLRGARWGADGITFATSQRATGLFHVEAAGGAPRSLTTPNLSQGERDHVWPDVLPEGRGTLFAIARENRAFDIAVLPAGAAAWRVVIRGGSSPRYLPTGHVAYVADGVLYGVGFDLQSLSVTTDPVALVDGVLTKPSGAADVAIAPNGTLAYVPGRDLQSPHRLVWLAMDGTTTPLPLDARNFRRARLSPDGQRVAVSLEERGATSIWVHDTSRDTFTRVTPRDTSAADPVWSPDGRRLAYWSETDKAILMMAADGSGAPVRLARAESGTYYPTAWSPDGVTLAFVRELPTLDLRGVSTSPPHEVRPLATGAGAQVEAAFSPNGRWIAHVAFDGNVPEIVIGPAGSTDRRWPVASRGRHPAWSTDRELLFHEGAAIHRIAIDPATGLPIGRPAKVLDLPPAVAAIRPIEPSRDGRRFLVLERVEGEDRAPEIRLVLNWLDDVRAKTAGANRRPPQ